MIDHAIPILVIDDSAVVVDGRPSDAEQEGKKGDEDVEEDEEKDGEMDEAREGSGEGGETASPTPVDVEALEAKLAAEKEHQEAAQKNVNLLKALGTSGGAKRSAPLGRLAEI